MFKNKGFTLIELITIMGIVAIIGTISTLTIVQTRNINLLDLTAKELVANLLDTQQKAIVQLESDSWGIYINTSGERDYYEVFHGDDYVGGTIVGRTSLPAKIEFVEPLQGETEEILFNKITGYPQDDHRLLLGLKGDTSETRAIRIVTIGEIGLVSLTDTPLDPLAPRNLSATGGDNKIDLVWQAPASNGGGELTGYKVYRGTSSGVYGSPTTIGNQLSYSDTSVVAGTTYYYVVSAVNTAGESPQSNEDSGSSNVLPSAPQNLNAVGSDSQVSLTWQAPADDGGSSITNYKIYRDIISPVGLEDFLIQLGAQLSYVDTDVSNGTTYYYKVSALNNIGESPLSSEDGATTLNIPSAPQNLVATSDVGEIDLSWQTPADDGGSPITGYEISRGTSSSSYDTTIPLGVQTTYTDTNVSDGITYYYVVRAINSIGNSIDSNEDSATIIETPSAPQNLVLTDGNSQIDLIWQEPASDGGSAITGYKISRGTSSGSYDTTFIIGTQLSYSDTDISIGLTYYYVVSAINSAGEGDNSIENSVSPQYNISRVFVTESTYNGNLGGLNGADSICQSVAINAGLSGTWSAWLSTASVSASSRLDHSLLPYVRLDGLSIANNWDDLVDGSLSNPLNISDQNNISIVNVFSATNYDGAYIGRADCSAWTSNAFEANAAYGSSSAINTTWSHAGFHDSYDDGWVSYSGGCIQNYHLYCFDQDAYGINSIPDTPTNFNASTTGETIILTWDSPIPDGSSSINLYKGTSSGVYDDPINIGNRLTYTDSDIVYGNTYYYKISSINALGESLLTSEVSTASEAVPSMVNNLTATITNVAEVTLNWTTPESNGSSITSYKIYRDTFNNVDLNDFYTSISPSQTYVDTDIIDGNTYYYRIVAVNGVGDADLSNEVSAIGTPNAPTSVKAKTYNQMVGISWDTPFHNGSLITGYKIYRSETNGSRVLIDTVGLVNVYFDSGLTNGITYYYQVAAINGLGDSNDSNQAYTTPNSYMRTFVTNATMTGYTVNGLDGADTHCQNYADSQLLGGVWKAWLSGETVSASSRLTHSILPYKTLNGAIIADNWNDLIDGSLSNPLNITETGSVIGSEKVWTNTNWSGNIFGQYRSCDNWHSLGTIYGDYFGAYGYANATDLSWTDGSTSGDGGYLWCSNDNQLRLYCMEEMAESPWQEKTSMTYDRNRAGYGSATVNNKIYVIGGGFYPSGMYPACCGNPPPPEYYNYNEEYDPATDNWTVKASMPTARYGLIAAAVNNKIYAIGGTTSTGITGVVEEYDPSTNTWNTNKTSMPTPRNSARAEIIDGKVYVLGGNNGSWGSWQEVYDPVSDSWQQKSSMTYSLDEGGIISYNSKIYLVGGYDWSAGNMSSSLVSVDSSDNWSTYSNMDEARYKLSSGVLNGVIYASGGYDSGWGNTNRHDRYDLSTDIWTNLTSMPSYLSINQIHTEEANEKIYVFDSFNMLEYDPTKE